MAPSIVLTEKSSARERERGSDFSELSRRITEAGLLRRRPLYYTVRFGTVALALAGSVAAFVALGDSWGQLFVALALAVVFGQLGLAAHDLAHRQVFTRRRPSEIGGLFTADLLLGMSYGWWMNKHTRHHANPNHEEKDPDVSPDILVWSRRQARQAAGIPRFVGKHQAALFFPLLTLEGLNLSFNSFKALRGTAVKRPVVEGTLLVAHFALYFGGLFTVLPPARRWRSSPSTRACSGSTSARSSPPTTRGADDRGGHPAGLPERQVLTARNGGAAAGRRGPGRPRRPGRAPPLPGLPTEPSAGPRRSAGGTAPSWASGRPGRARPPRVALVTCAGWGAAAGR
ncbi:hypothetical protein SFUMM280S_06274 [Streptomyces fumanus]